MTFTIMPLMKRKYGTTKQIHPLQKLLVLTGKPFYLATAFSVIGLAILVVTVKQRLEIALQSLFHLFGIKDTGSLTLLRTLFSTIRVQLRNIHFFYHHLKKSFHQPPTGKFEVYKRPGNLRKKWNTLQEYSSLITAPLRQLYARLPARPRWKIRIFPQSRLGRFAFSLALILCVISGASTFIYYYVFEDLPSPLEVSSREQILTTKIYDRYGTELYRLYKDENRTLIKLSDLPPHVINATLAIEDAQFYSHRGFSPKGIARAIKVNFQDGKVHGGSTITQQLVKNRLLSSEKELKRKVREVILAVAVDALYSKEEILEMYFNQISYGGSTYGIEEASLRYFNKHAKDLTLQEATLLAGVPAAPTRYSPFGAHPELAVARQQEVLRRMAEEGFISYEQISEVLEQPLVLNEDRTNIEAPHFVMYVRSLLVDMYGESVVSQGGLEVYTTLDLDLQHQTQQIVSDEVAQLGQYRISNGAALVSKPNTGEILAMVGSVNYFDIKNDGQVNITQRLRQPGSSIKPLTYALALEQGFTPTTRIEDAPITYSIPGSKPYTPKNYDGKFHGNVTLKDALANSYNIPAVKLLATLGVQNLIDKAEMMGIDTWQERNRFGLSLTLGGGEVTMIDMNELYGTFANGGSTVELNPLLLVKDAKGNILYQNTCAQQDERCPKRKSLEPLVAYQINRILSDNQARSSAFGSNSVLHIPDQEVAVKTGTTNSLRDNWTIGYTEDRVVATWVGNNDNSPMSYVASGITGASPIWNKIIRLQLDPNEPHAFSVPDNLKKVAICSTTGTLTCQACPQTVEEYFIPGTEPTQHCSPEQFNKTVQTL